MEALNGNYTTAPASCADGGTSGIEKRPHNRTGGRAIMRDCEGPLGVAYTNQGNIASHLLIGEPFEL